MQPIVLSNKNHGRYQLEKNTYLLKQTNPSCRWPVERGQKLGQCGIWNVLWRVGFHPLLCPVEKLPRPDNNSVLFVDEIDLMDEFTLKTLRQWMQAGGKLVATGELESWKSFFPSNYHWQTSFFDDPHAALAYELDDYSIQLIAPPKWNFVEYEGPDSSAFFHGSIASIQGERQSPERALVFPCPKAPVLIQHGLFYYFNGHPFAAFQAWLQGQENLSTWLAWRHRLFWLDESASFFYDFMLKFNIFNEEAERPGIAGLNKTTIVLRHDLDYSRDLSFLNEENQRNIPATHAVLKDRNTKFWTKELRKFKNQEIAFHYNTGKRNWHGLIRRTLFKENHIPFTPHSKQIAGNGLLKQLKWAKKNGINVQTIHRHLCYLIYPEWVDALDNVYEKQADLLGSSSLFRAQVLKWGIDRIDGHHGFLAETPDSQFPISYPFKLAHAGKNGKILRGWETTALMEIEPALLTQLLNHPIKHITQRVFTLIFHPAHANKSLLYPQGSMKYFKQILDIITDDQISIQSMSTMFQAANTSLGEKGVNIN